MAQTNNLSLFICRKHLVTHVTCDVVSGYGREQKDPIYILFYLEIQTECLSGSADTLSVGAIGCTSDWIITVRIASIVSHLVGLVKRAGSISLSFVSHPPTVPQIVRKQINDYWQHWSYENRFNDSADEVT